MLKQKLDRCISEPEVVVLGNIQVAPKNSSVPEQNAVMMFPLLGISCSTRTVTFDPPALIPMLPVWLRVPH